VIELVDTSVWAARRRPQVQKWFERQLLAREIAVCDQVRLELLHSARNVAEFRTIRSSLAVLPYCPMDAPIWSKVVEVYELLAAAGPQWHRSVKHPDLIIAACAEAAGLTLVHYDKDFDAIAAVTGQSTRWVAPQGSL
jgi:predicted nucleic acid-binding protein